MTQSRDLPALLERLGEAALDARALIRELHEMQQALRAIKEAKHVIDRDARAVVEIAVKRGLDELGDDMQNLTTAAAAKITDEFERHARPMLETLEMISSRIRELEAGLADGQ